jgi:hypothetical protein
LIIYALQAAAVAVVNTIPGAAALVDIKLEQASLLLPVIH